MTVPPYRDNIISKSNAIDALSASHLVSGEAIFAIYAGNDRISGRFTHCRPAVHNAAMHDPEIAA